MIGFHRGAVTINGLNKQFIEKCRAEGRITIDRALEIAEGLGMFDDDYAGKAIVRDKKQKIRYLLCGVTNDGERAIRSIRLDDRRVYVDLFNIANLTELNLLIRAENQRIAKSKKIITSLRRVKHLMIGQISLDDLYSDAL